MVNSLCEGNETCSETVRNAVANMTTTTRLKAYEVGSYPFASGVVLYGLTTVSSSWPIFCDHFHLYSFYYSLVTPQGASDAKSDLEVWGASMIGFPDACNYNADLAIPSEITEDTVFATTGD